MAKKIDELLDHNYDGIQEYDNDLPRWWVYLFAITVVWGLVYVVWFHSGETPEQQLAAQMAEIGKKQAVANASSAQDTDESLLALITAPSMVSHGKELYTTRCVACHGAAGEGLVGPNLTDDNWIHGAKPTQIKRTIQEGVLDKGMIAWKTTMTSDEINAVLAYVWSLHGTNPPNAKAPQGDLVPRS